MSRWLNMFPLPKPKLQGKIVLLLTGCSFISLLIACSAFVLFDRQTHLKLGFERLEQQAKFMAAFSDTAVAFDDQLTATNLLNNLGLDSHLIVGAVFRADGSEFARYVRSDSPFQMKLPVVKGEFRRQQSGSIEISYHIDGPDGTIGHVYLQQDLGEAKKRSGQYIWIALSVAAFSFLAAVALSVRVQRSVTGPVVKLAKVADRVATEQNFDLRAAKESDDEIGVLVERFNEMMRQIQQRDHELQQARSELELRVTERTAELSTTNEQLTHEVEVRQEAEAELKQSQQQLEERVERRTGQLSRTNELLQSEVETRKTAEDALRHSQLRLTLHVEQTPLGVVDWSPAGEVVSWNPAAEFIFGWSESESRGRQMRELLAEEAEQIRFDAAWKAMLEGRQGDRTIVHNHTKKGNVIICEWFNTPLINDDDEIFAVSSLVLDISARVEAERSLIESEERFSKVFRASPAPVAILTLPEGDVLDANDSFLDITGHSRNELIGHRANDVPLWGISVSQDEIFQIASHEGGLRNHPCWVRTVEGKERHIKISGEAVRLGDKDCVLLICQDLTERENLENQLRQSQKMEAVGQLASGVAHDFNNLLTIILGHGGMLASELQPGSDHSEMVDEMCMAAERASDLTRQLLAYSRKQVMQTHVVDLNSVVSNSTRIIRRLLSARVELKTELGQDKLYTEVDVSMVEQVLMNLAVNARDAMDDNGVLTISLHQESLDRAASDRHADACAGDFACIHVTDTGAGMDGSTMERIFDPFFTTKDVGKGTGLGLSTAIGIAKQHGGWIEVESQIEHGTTFKVYLPLLREAVQIADEETVASPDVSSGRETILVVEDEPALRKSVERILRRCGYEIHTAEDGPAAIEKWKTIANEVDLLLADVVMPREMSGTDLARQLREDRPDLPVILTSGYSPEFFGKNGRVSDLDNFLPKPYRMTKLTELIRKVLDERESLPRRTADSTDSATS